MKGFRETKERRWEGVTWRQRQKGEEGFRDERCDNLGCDGGVGGGG